MSLRKNGLLFIFLSDLFFGFLPILVKWANHQGYSALQATFFRFGFALAGILILMVWGWQKIRIVNLQALFWRGFFGGWSVFFFFITLQHSTAAKATLLNYTYSIWANVFDVAIFRRQPPRLFWPALLIAGVGVWLVLGIQWSGFQWGDATGIISGMTSGAAVLSVKEARRTDNALSVFTSFSIFGFIIAGLFLWWGPALGMDVLAAWHPLDGKGWLLLLSMGLVGMLAQVLFTHGYGYTSLAVGALFSLLVPVFAALFGLVLLGEGLTPHFVLGTLLILGACGLLARPEVAQV
jgi:drug/metabolite transporter (DMT)-like permease